MALTKVQIDGVEFSDSTDLNVDNGTFVVDSTNNRVGVGTTSPNNRLHIKQSGDTYDTALSIEASSGTARRLYVGVDHSAGAGVIGTDTHDLILDATGARSVISKTNGTERLRIDSSGRVGIGTSSPGSYSSYADDLVVSASDGNSGITVVGGTSGYSSLYLADGTSGSATAEGFVQFDHTNNKLYLGSGATTALTIDSSQRVGIGSSAPLTTLECRGQFSISNNSGSYWVLDRDDSDGRLKLLDSSTSTNERLAVDSSGRLLVGTSSSTVINGDSYKTQIVASDASAGLGITRTTNSVAGPFFSLVKSRNGAIVSSGDTLGQIQFIGHDGTDFNTASATIEARVDGTPGENDMPGRLVFLTTADGAGSPTERLRIGSNGFAKFSNTASYTNASEACYEFNSDASNVIAMRIRHNGTSGQQYGLYIQTADDQNDSVRYFLQCVGSSTQRLSIRSNGGIANYQANNVNLCDEREKKNIETLDSTWNCLKNWELKKFHYNEDADTDDKRYGVIAQQVAPHCPEVITDWVKQVAADAVLDDDGNVVTPAKEEIVRMGVKEQQMMWMAIKALQEAQTRIETLEAEVAALKGA